MLDHQEQLARDIFNNENKGDKNRFVSALILCPIFTSDQNSLLNGV
tara:strand:- start:2463 stop:2600 length:138 start_codon:yes stop_codon:yes gene_type:complete